MEGQRQAAGQVEGAWAEATWGPGRPHLQMTKQEGGRVTTDPGLDMWVHSRIIPTTSRPLAVVRRQALEPGTSC